MTSPPKLTIITVCYNSEAYIADALKSVDIQTLQDREHLVIDGASRDGTLRVIQQHPHPTRRVISEPDKGIYDAMNKGLRLARGEIIGFINSDDFYPGPQVLSDVTSAFDDPAVDAVYGNLCYVRQNEPNVVVRYWRSCPFVPGMFLRAWCPPHPTLFIRRAVYERLGGFDTSYSIASDVELMTRYFEVHRVKTVHLDEVLVHMRMGGTTNNSLRNILQQNREIWRGLVMHRLNPSLLRFVAYKLYTRARQYMARPAA